MPNRQPILQKSFNRELFSLVLPIALQNLVSALVISADVLMLGFVSQSAMSAVSLAGQITFMLTLFYMGLSMGAGILVAQYWGKKDTATIQRLLGLAGTFSLCISFLFFVVCVAFPEVLMRFFTNDPELIRYGALFLQPLSFSYLAMGISQIYLGVMRSIEKARFSAWISSACLLLNIALNALCIFVWFPGQPGHAVVAVAVATVCARWIELAGCVFHSLLQGPIQLKLPPRDGMQRKLLRDFLRYTLPVQGNYIVWGGALTVTAAVIGHVSAELVAANSVASVVKNLAVVLCGGVASGGAVLISKYLGRGELEKAKQIGRRLIAYSLFFGVIAGAAVLAMKIPVFALVRLSSTAEMYLDGMLNICAVYCIAKSLNAVTIAGLFPAGGDSMFGFWCDTIVMWGIVLPLSYLCAFVWSVPPLALYAVISMDEFVKLPAAIWRYRQYKWLNNLTRDFDSASSHPS
ncbi:MATE family efflux transporter [Saccharibacillus sacchari]|uniref:MATE family efflux transporter n=1 Tax=Saccharibacillus sacchari TaxID=456493 RepID=A0ACC6PCX9_9BACL